jgi:chemotaxis protein methyltransferase CheR
MDDFALLKHFIEKTLGIQCSNYKEDYIRRRLLSRMRSSGKETYEDYLRYVQATPAELENLRNALTINVTEFFRDNGVYEFIKKDILPSLFSRRKRLRIWCAGCSTGEEPYSLAMILSEIMAQNPELSAHIFATDIDKVVLSRAREGIYTQKAMAKLSEAQIHRHFTRLSDGNYQAKPYLKDMIRFQSHDLMSGAPVSRWLDLVICRNVTIYFNEKQKDELAKIFHDSLVPGGFYVMGKTEYLGRTADGMFVPYDSLQKIFKRKD